MQAFAELSATRSYGMQANALAPRDVHSWLLLTGIPPEEWAEYWKAIRVLDDEWIRVREERRKKDD